MNRLWKILIALLSLVVLCALAACGGEVSDGTTQAPGVPTDIPTENPTSTPTDAPTDALCETHTMKDGVCTVCGLPESSEGLEFLLNDDGTYTVTGIGTCAETDIVIGVYHGKSVTAVGAGAFYGCDSLADVTIGNSIAIIGSWAFRYCTSLTSVIVPDSVTEIWENAFSSCTDLASITIPDSVTNIGERAFYDTAYYNSASNWENNTLYIGNHLIAAKASISGSCIIKKGIICIGEGSFTNCDSLTGVVIPDSVISIGKNAFSYCDSLTQIAIGSGTVSIGDCAFSGCNSLASVTIPNSVTCMGEDVFWGCDGLMSINIGKNVTSIGNYAFFDCTNLTSITVAPDNKAYHSSGNCLIETASKTLIVGCKSSIIPTDGSVASIGSSAFSGCSGLTSITIPDGVTSIGDCAFYNCTGLKSITIPDGVTGIGASAFEGCTGLTSIVYQNTQTEWKKVSKGRNYLHQTSIYLVIQCTDKTISRIPGF